MLPLGELSFEVVDDDECSVVVVGASGAGTTTTGAGATTTGAGFTMMAGGAGAVVVLVSVVVLSVV